MSASTKETEAMFTAHGNTGSDATYYVYTTHPIDTHLVVTSFKESLDLRDQSSDGPYNEPAYISLEHGKLPSPGT